MMRTVVTDENFGREVLGAAPPVLVAFHGEGPSARASHAAFTAIAPKFSGRLKFASADVAHNPEACAEYKIRGLPTIILFKSGKPVARRIGVNGDDFEEWVRSTLVGVLASRRVSTARAAEAFKLSNGLQGVVIPDHRAPIVTHALWYKVGAADEPVGLSGIAPLLAHLTFISLEKTTVGGFARTISRLGGERNGSGDRNSTLYYERIGKEHLEVMMEIEAERMSKLNLTDRDVEIEREVFMESQREARENSPADALIEKVKEAHFRGHRHSIPALGKLEEACKISLDDLRRFHHLHYAPNNTVLVVSGDLTLEEVTRLAQRAYGRIPANLEAGRSRRPNVPVYIANQRIVVENTRTDTSEIRRRYTVPGYGVAKPGEAEALQVLAHMLEGANATSLYRRLAIESQRASAARAGYLGYAGDMSCFWVHAISSDGDLGALEAGVDAVLSDIRRNGVSHEDLESAKAAVIANYIFEGTDQFKLTLRYGSALAIGLTREEIEGWPAAISKVSAADVKRVATTYLIDRRAVTGWLAPGEQLRRREPLGRVHS